MRLIERLDEVDFDRLLRELEPFLIEPADRMLCSRELLISDLEQMD